MAGRHKCPAEKRQGWFWALLVLVTCAMTCAEAQQLPRAESSGQPSMPPSAQLQAQPTPPGHVLPPVPLTPDEKTERLPLSHVLVRQIRVLGSTVFSAPELAAVTQPYENRELSAEELEELRLALTRFYIERGYLTSGAILPPQTVTAGVITLRMIEGRLTRIEVEGNRWFRDGYIRRRLALGAKAPVHIAPLQERLQLLQQDARIERLHAQLRPGVQRGESVLHVRLEEALPFYVALEFNNHQPPTVGAERGLMTVAHRNLTGHGDILSATFGRSAGTDFEIDASYALPLTARDLTLLVRYQRDDTRVVEGAFAPLDIESESDIFGVTLRQPLYHTLRREVALVLSGELERSKTFFLGEPFPSPGAENGESAITALRLALEWAERLPHQVIAARSRFSFGVDALGATISDNSDVPDGRFHAWLGQLQWVRRLGVWDIQTLLRLDVQLAFESLLPLEQMAVGGRLSVRGYRENQLVRDSGLILSCETRIPLIRNKAWADSVELAPFVDFGHTWNIDLPTFSPKTIASVGVGLRWHLTVSVPPTRLRPQFEIYWGYPLKDVDTAGGNLQDLGLHLQFVIATL